MARKFKFGDVVTWADTKLPNNKFLMVIGKDSAHPGEADFMMAITRFGAAKPGEIHSRWNDLFKKAEDDE